MTFNFDDLKDVLVCPQCRSELVHEGDRLICTGADCRLSYMIKDDIPIMLVDEATALSQDEWSRAVKPAGQEQTG